MVASKFPSSYKSSMKVSDRLLIVILCASSALFLIFMVHSKINYRLLQEKYEDLAKINEILKKETIESDAKRTTRRTTQKYVPRIVYRENKFKDMAQFSVQNPDFRRLMEWPTRVKYSTKNPTIAEMLNKTIKPGMSSWEKFNLRVSKKHLYEEDSSIIRDLLHDMNTQKIVAVEDFPWGMQFKLTLYFENGGIALFKPQRFPKDRYINQNTLYFSDFERHNSEIAAFHLDKVIGFRKTPPVVGRKVNITSELYPLASDNLYKTFFLSPDGNYCFNGVCPLYCTTFHAFCGDPFLIEGSVSVWVGTEPYSFDLNTIKNPWRRTYDAQKRAKWEDDPYYCEFDAREIPPFDEEIRIYDVVDLAVFDFLTGNMDRPTYEYHKGFGNDSDTTLLHLDNGRGFGRPERDEPSILAPLSQCCVIRLSTFNRLYSLHTGPRPLSDLMRESLQEDPLAPVLTEPHLEALDRRVDKVLEAINKCIKANSPAQVFLDDVV